MSRSTAAPIAVEEPWITGPLRDPGLELERLMHLPRPKLFRAGAVVDAGNVWARPGALLVRDASPEGPAVMAAGDCEAIGVPAECEVVDLPGAVIMPALVNAHCHLDLSHLGPGPYPGTFVEWVDRIRAGRATTPGGIGAATRKGVALARAGGTGLIGDIAGAGSLVPMQILREEGLAGVSFLEVFGLGRGQEAAVRRLRQAAGAEPAASCSSVRLGLQPHAPYSCGPRVYTEAADLGLPLSTHVAETLEELQFVESATGPLAEMIRRIGVWDDSIDGAGEHPVDLLLRLLDGRPCLVAHLNYVDDEHIDRLTRSAVSVAYCPRASAYFGHPVAGHAPHRYREMIEAGIVVALGTDGMPCLDTPDRLSVLDDMRLLHRRDGTEPRRLLEMATIAGARALGADPDLVTFRTGPVAGIVAVDGAYAVGGDPVRAVLANDQPPRWLLAERTAA
ncbi:MAG: amidohydrolase family protein [Planctomycetota bacterium]